METFGPRLIDRVAEEAPGVRLWFVPKPDKDSAPLREGEVDLATGVTGRAMGPEIQTRSMFQDRFISVVRRGHPLAKGRITPKRYAAAAHVSVARRGLELGPLDEAFEQRGLVRRRAATVGGFASAIALACASDLVATVPESHTRSLWRGMHAFELPFPVPGFTISLFWHPRMEADAAHRWMRARIHDEC